MSEATDEGEVGERNREFESAVEARLQADFACAEPDAERVAATVARARAAGDLPDWSPVFVVEKLADAPGERTIHEKWNWLLGYVGGDADSDEYRLDG
ncbi:hypothetical protein [Halorussus litoreus]|uniref:hypothetical protein n=1 Tax=Halorussus litoreus TaxID=1710536 RepID=UPI000E22F889|nr:hypothetical protein [Halorussus litoreus]